MVSFWLWNVYNLSTARRSTLASLRTRRSMYAFSRCGSGSFEHVSLGVATNLRLATSARKATSRNQRTYNFDIQKQRTWWAQHARSPYKRQGNNPTGTLHLVQAAHTAAVGGTSCTANAKPNPKLASALLWYGVALLLCYAGATWRIKHHLPTATADQKSTYIRTRSSSAMEMV
jgi:hypothetical protein